MNRILLIAALFFFGCKSADKYQVETGDLTIKSNNESPAELLATSMSNAHNLDSFQNMGAFSFDLKLTFRGKKRFEGRIMSTTGSDRIIVRRRTDGSILLYNGEKVLLHPDTADWKNGRFDIFTWQYFAFAPFKLTDPGTHWSEYRKLPLFGDSLNTAKLSFSENTGDAPDDWYIAYQDNSTGLLAGMAYIVTYSKDQKEAEKAPHAITYHDYVQIEGNWIPRVWRFWDWSEAGLGEQIGEGRLRRLQSVPVTDKRKVFSIPQPYRELER